MCNQQSLLNSTQYVAYDVVMDTWQDRAKKRMKSLGLTQAMLCDTLGVKTQGAVGHYFTGRRKLSSDQAIALAKQLQVSLEELFDSNTEGTRIRALRIERYLTTSELSQNSGVPEQDVQDIEEGERSPSEEELIAIAKAFGVPVGWLTEGEQDAEPYPSLSPVPQYNQIPVLDVELAAGNGTHIDMERVTDWVPISQDWIQEKQYSKDRLVVVSVIGDSMMPRLHEGDMLLVNTADQKPASGNVYAIAVDNELRVKRLIKRMDGAWIISSDNKANPAYQDEIISNHNFDQLRIIGRAVKVVMGDI
ncbi:helix-turn-helix domain-containing protein [Pontibacterium sp.]|uniref:helix-turn-helix domain-containing protein n=1 Tax=Pontibacterium sp. TaxID=2036026 RepID=UPI0035671589